MKLLVIVNGAGGATAAFEARKFDEEKNSLLTGSAAIEALKERMARDNWNCREHKGAQA